MFNNNKGLTLVEILVTMVIILVILSAIYFTYDTILKGFKKETKSIESELQSVIGIELLRLDIEHAGYGLAKDLDNKPIELSNNILDIRSTINNTNKETIGYVVVNCPDTTSSWKNHIISDEREDKSAKYINFLDLDKNFKGFVKATDPCPAKGYLIGFPVDFDGTSPPNGCGSTPPKSGEQFCNLIEYKLSNTQPLQTCNPDTRNLIRKVGQNANGEPLIPCVSEWLVKIKLKDGTILYDTSSLTAQNIRKKVEQIIIYLVLQEGRKSLKPQFNQNKLSIDGINFYLTDLRDYQYYKWKLIKVGINPMDL